MLISCSHLIWTEIQHCGLLLIAFRGQIILLLRQKENKNFHYLRDIFCLIIQIPQNNLAGLKEQFCSCLRLSTRIAMWVRRQPQYVMKYCHGIFVFSLIFVSDSCSDAGWVYMNNFCVQAGLCNCVLVRTSLTLSTFLQHQVINGSPVRRVNSNISEFMLL